MAKEIILGIDLGTTNSVVSYLQADGYTIGLAYFHPEASFGGVDGDADYSRFHVYEIGRT